MRTTRFEYELGPYPEYEPVPRKSLPMHAVRQVTMPTLVIQCERGTADQRLSAGEPHAALDFVQELAQH